jgi:hypothetical protein
MNSGCGRDFAQPHARVMGDAQQDPAVLGQEDPALQASNPIKF